MRGHAARTQCSQELTAIETELGFLARAIRSDTLKAPSLSCARPISEKLRAHVPSACDHWVINFLEHLQPEGTFGFIYLFGGRYSIGFVAPVRYSALSVSLRVVVNCVTD